MTQRITGLSLLLATAALALAACRPAPASPDKTAATAVREPTAVPAATAAPAAPKPAIPTASLAPTAAPAAKPPAQPVFDEKAVADFYAGKTVRVVVGFPPGGGYDVLSRLLARHMGRYVPGNPSIIVENMPGAAGLVAANHVYTAAPKDGTVIANMNGEALAIEQLFGNPSVQYDVTKIRYLGSPHGSTYVLIVSKASGVMKFEDIVGPNAKQLIIGASAPGSMVYDGALLLREALGASVKVVPGYAGTANYMGAMESGEVDAFINPWETIKGIIADRLASGEFRLLGQFTETPQRDLPNVPEFLKMAGSDEQRQLLRLRAVVTGQFAIQYWVAPEVDSGRAQALEAAFGKTMADQEFLASAAQVQVEPAPKTGAELQKLVMDFLGMPPSMRTRMQALVRT